LQQKRPDHQQHYQRQQQQQQQPYHKHPVDYLFPGYCRCVWKESNNGKSPQRQQRQQCRERQLQSIKDTTLPSLVIIPKHKQIAPKDNAADADDDDYQRQGIYKYYLCQWSSSDNPNIVMNDDYADAYDENVWREQQEGLVEDMMKMLITIYRKSHRILISSIFLG
jgi:hypothetical protein